MHEMSIAEGIIEIVERTAGRSGVTRVKEVRIEVGELAGVDCAKTVPLAKYGDPCPVCGGFHLAATGGTEMRVIDFVPED